MTPLNKLRKKIKDSGLTHKAFAQSMPPLIIEQKLSVEMLVNWLYGKRNIPKEWKEHLDI